jgi:CRISPR/Cas system-associated exonuclease Cas4 (RecB family)
MEVVEKDGRWFAKKNKKAKTTEDITDIVKIDGDFCSVMGRAGRTEFHSYLGKIGTRWVEMHGVTSLLNYWGEKERLLQWAVDRAVDYIAEAHSHNEVILKDARSAHRRSLKEAGDHGTSVHELAEEWIKDGSHADHPQLQELIQWVETNNVKILHSEIPLRSKSRWLAGTADGICEMNGQKYVFDFKTSRFLNAKHWYQIAAYALMFEEMYGEHIKGGILIHMPRDGGFNISITNDLSGDKKAFDGIYTAFKHEKTNRHDVWKN